MTAKLRIPSLNDHVITNAVWSHDAATLEVKHQHHSWSGRTDLILMWLQRSACFRSGLFVHTWTCPYVHALLRNQKQEQTKTKMPLVTALASTETLTITRAASVRWKANCTEPNGNRDNFRSTDVRSISGSIPNVWEFSVWKKDFFFF